MRSRLAGRLVSLAALLPLLAFVVAGIGYDRFRCTFTGEVSEMGCCPADDPPAAPVVTGASCCDHETALRLRVPVEPAPARELAPLDVFAVALPAPFTPEPAPAATFAPPAPGRAPPRPPLVLVKQSFLI
ncbi:MAG TPA: hypothetical protein VHK47_16095 [Polyangia bacterium]|jgi:hypothetical protein|nr:hypothetical protein [Polyangia bacterium]